jgi:hypothetical protein
VNIIFSDSNKSYENFDGLIFLSADQDYFHDHAVFLINSIIENCPFWAVHIHLIDPSDEIIQSLSRYRNLTFSVTRISKNWLNERVKSFRFSSDIEYMRRVLLTIKSHDRNKLAGILEKIIDLRCFNWLLPHSVLQKYFFKCYVASQRFIALNHLVENKKIHHLDVYALDADALVIGQIPSISSNSDVLLMCRETPFQRFLAGGMWFPNAGRRVDFLSKFSEIINERLSKGQVEWGLDQIILDEIVPKFNFSKIDEKYFDLHFNDTSYVWLAKGNSKKTFKYLEKKQRYSTKPLI